jgi:hypothetical protein
VGKIRKSKSSDRAIALVVGAVSGVALAAIVACTDTPPVVPTVSDLPDASRRPDGVMIDPPAAMPSSVVRADARGVVALREPPGSEAVREIVMALVHAFEREDFSALDSLLSPDATGIEGRGSRALLLMQWRGRMQQLEYSRLAGMEIVRPEKIQRFEYDELGGQDELPRPAEMKPGDVFARIPVEVPRIGPDRFFGETILMVLRRVDGRFKIAAYGEVDGK